MMLSGKTVFITGATKGIGLGIAIACLENGMKVLINGRKAESTQSVVEDLEKRYPGRVLSGSGNVTDLEAMKSASQKLSEKWGSIDVVIANAGVGHFASIEDLSTEQWNEVIDVNLTGVFNTIKATVEDLKKSKGYFITIASLAGTNFFAKGAAYNASKFGLVGFTQAVMLDLRQHDVKCSTIMPGSVSTYFNNRTPSDSDAWKIQPEDIGQITIDLLKMPARTLPSKVEVRPSKPPQK